MHHVDQAGFILSKNYLVFLVLRLKAFTTMPGTSSVLKITFFKLKKLITSHLEKARVSVHGHVTLRVWQSEDTSEESVSLPTVWVPGIELGSSVLAAGSFIHWVILAAMLRSIIVMEPLAL